MKIKRIRFGGRMSVVDVGEGQIHGFGIGVDSISVSFTNTLGRQPSEHFRVEFSREEWAEVMKKITAFNK